MMKNAEKQGGIALRAGLFGGLLFAASLLIFGALTPGYSHVHKSVSELGAFGVPWGRWFDFFGLFLPGLLAAGVAFELRRRLRVVAARTRWATGLLIFAGMLALTAIPADLARMFQSPWTWVHAFFALGAIPVFFVVIPGCAKALRTLGASGAAAKIFFALGYLPAVEIPLYGVFPHAPGLVQRLMLLTIHFFFAWLSWMLLRLRRPPAA